MKLTSKLKSMHCPKCEAAIPIHSTKCKYCHAHIINLLDTQPSMGEIAYVKLAVNYGGEIRYIDFATNLFTDMNYQAGDGEYRQLTVGFGYQPPFNEKKGNYVYRISQEA